MLVAARHCRVNIQFRTVRVGTDAIDLSRLSHTSLVGSARLSDRQVAGSDQLADLGHIPCISRQPQ